MIVVTLGDIIGLSFLGLCVLFMIFLLVCKTISDYKSKKEYKKERLEYLRKNPMFVTDDDLKLFNKKDLPR